jgi:hypothetical protein
MVLKRSEMSSKDKFIANRRYGYIYKLVGLYAESFTDWIVVSHTECGKHVKTKGGKARVLATIWLPIVNSEGEEVYIYLARNVSSGEPVLVECGSVLGWLDYYESGHGKLSKEEVIRRIENIVSTFDDVELNGLSLEREFDEFNAESFAFAFGQMIQVISMLNGVGMFFARQEQ